MAKRPNKNKFKEIATKRIDRLFLMAQESVTKNIGSAKASIVSSDIKDNIQGREHALFFSQNCIKHAKEIALKHQISLKGEKRRLVCRKCSSYLYPGVSCNVRLRSGKLIYHCNNCKNFNKFIYKNQDEL